MRQLLIDTLPFEVPRNLLSESIKSGRTLEVKGVIQREDAKNHNGRVYPGAVLRPAVEAYINVFVREKRAYGELDHPDRSIVELKNTSHMITEAHWEGKDLIGTCAILSTPSGNILKEILSCGGVLGISSRALGSLTEAEHNGEMVNRVGDDLELVCWDFVSNPSVIGSFMKPTSSHQGDLTLKESIVRPQLNRNYAKFKTAEFLMRDILIELS